MRGRALETVITPFGFRRFARDRGVEWESDSRLVGAVETSARLAYFDEYVGNGGFSEAGRMDSGRERVALLQGYVDGVLFRDIVERHGIANVLALRAFVRQLLQHAPTLFSVSKVHADFRSRGIAVSKETLLAMLAHLEDALRWLVRLCMDRNLISNRQFLFSEKGMEECGRIVGGWVKSLASTNGAEGAGSRPWF